MADDPAAAPAAGPAPRAPSPAEWVVTVDRATGVVQFVGRLDPATGARVELSDAEYRAVAAWQEPEVARTPADQARARRSWVAGYQEATAERTGAQPAANRAADPAGEPRPAADAEQA
nr:hypothetical protein [uncultured bacterium]